MAVMRGEEEIFGEERMREEDGVRKEIDATLHH